VAGWQVAVMWPIYLITALFPSPLLRVFGDEVVEAKGAVIAIAVAMLIAAPAGPVASVILMAGRSRQAMLNTLVLVAINVTGNLLLRSAARASPPRASRGAPRSWWQRLLPGVAGRTARSGCRPSGDPALVGAAHVGRRTDRFWSGIGRPMVARATRSRGCAGAHR
jgi:hypothetical protein